MTEAEIRQAALDILSDIAPEIDPSAVGDEDDLRETLDLDSMDFLNFIAALHERTGVDVPEEDYKQLFTLGGAVAYLRSH